MSGHFSHRKTAGKVYETFYWPGIEAAIERFCKSCETCQRFTHKGKVKPVPLSHMSLVSEPFSKVAIDIVGLISPKSGKGHHYILTLVDCATRFLEATPLKETDTVTDAERLLGIFFR